MSWARDRIVAFLSDGRRVGRLATADAGGEPYVAPVWFRFEDGRLLVHTFAASRKARNVADSGRFALSVDTETWPYEAVVARGRARVARPDEIDHRGLVEAMAAEHLGANPGAAYGRWMAELPGEHVVLVLDPERLNGWDYR